MQDWAFVVTILPRAVATYQHGHGCGEGEVESGGMANPVVRGPIGSHAHGRHR
jgi:hypothetical protein